MKNKLKFYLGAGVLAVLVAVVAFAAGGGAEVETVEVKRDSITRAVEETGYVQPAEDYNLFAPQSARVVAVNVETGDPVKSGQTILIMENQDLSLRIDEVRSQLAQARAGAAGAGVAVERARLELAEAEKNMARVEELFQAGAVTPVEYEKAGTLVETYRHNLNEQGDLLEGALARVDALNRQMQQLTAMERQLVINSPAGGIILNLPVRRGEVVQPGALLATVAVPGRLEVRVDVLSDDLAEVRTGQQAVITAPVLGQKALAGVVEQIYPRAEEKQSALGVIQRRVPVIIALDDPGNLKPGYEVKVAVQTLRRENVPVVPREAVRTTAGGKQEVMVVVNNRVYHRTIETGISDAVNVEITAGLQPGDMVVRGGSLELPEKAKVKTNIFR